MLLTVLDAGERREAHGARTVLSVAGLADDEIELRANQIAASRLAISKNQLPSRTPLP